MKKKQRLLVPEEEQVIYTEVNETGVATVQILKTRSNEKYFHYKDYGIDVEVGIGGVPLGYDD